MRLTITDCTYCRILRSLSCCIRFFIDDVRGTNVGSSVAAIDGDCQKSSSITWREGTREKEQDFTPLYESAKKSNNLMVSKDIFLM